jgi:UTP--glucose-1-phosphate uridylyltransferase
MSVRKAVIPAAGLGTRFLPATKAQPKEMIPVIDKPGIQYVVEEAVRAGITDIVIVTSRGKGSIEDHFDRSLELEGHLEEKDKREELDEIRRISELGNIYFVRQKEPLGFGHAVACAREHIGSGPFAVMVGDELVPQPQGQEKPLLESMIDVYERRGGSVVTVQRVPREDVSAYGIVDGDEVEPGVLELRDMIEKPSPQDAPSELASRGRYVLAPAIFDALDRTGPGVGGEIQLTDAIRILVREASVFAYVHDGPIYDVGKKLDYLKATVELTLRRGDLAKPFKEWFVRRAAELE